jgi:hypothetical protein
MGFSRILLAPPSRRSLMLPHQTPRSWFLNRNPVFVCAGYLTCPLRRHLSDRHHAQGSCLTSTFGRHLIRRQSSGPTHPRWTASALHPQVLRADSGSQARPGRRPAYGRSRRWGGVACCVGLTGLVFVYCAGFVPRIFLNHNYCASGQSALVLSTYSLASVCVPSLHCSS